MAGSEALPIYKSALNLAVYVEQIVRGFEKYHKYTMGVELREKSKTLLFAINRANISDDKVLALTTLRDACEDMKMLIQLSKELQAFKNFKQFEHSSLLTVTVCKQAQAWLGATKRARGGGSFNRSSVGVPTSHAISQTECVAMLCSMMMFAYTLELYSRLCLSLQMTSVKRAIFTVRPFCQSA